MSYCNMNRIDMPKTCNYLDAIMSKTRLGHHIYVIERRMMDLTIPYNKLSKKQLKDFDASLVQHLQFLDKEH